MSSRRSKPHDPVVWEGLRTVGKMIELKVDVLGSCRACDRTWPLDLEAIAAQRGPFFTLVGRTLPCGQGHEANILARGPGGFMTPIHKGSAGEWSVGKKLRAVCGWCGLDHRGRDGTGVAPFPKPPRLE